MHWVEHRGVETTSIQETVKYTQRFLKELASLPKDIQSRAELIVFNELESQNPFVEGIYRIFP